MPVISRIVSMGLRAGEFIFACVVAGVVGKYLHDFDKTHSHGWPQARFIYTEAIAGISILLSLLWLLPFAGGFIHYPIDFLVACAWFAAFGLLVNSYHSIGCGSIWHWSGMVKGGFCNEMKASEAFSFLSAIFWIVSTFVGIWFVHKERRNGAVANGNVGRSRGRWYRRSKV